jgi:hypothetical protein
VTKCPGSGEQDVSDGMNAVTVRVLHTDKRRRHTLSSTDPKGKVEEVVEGKAETTTKSGKTMTKEGDEENPAVVIKAASGNNAIKKVSVGTAHNEGHDQNTTIVDMLVSLCTLSRQAKSMASSPNAVLVTTLPRNKVCLVNYFNSLDRVQ